MVNMNIDLMGGWNHHVVSHVTFKGTIQTIHLQKYKSNQVETLLVSARVRVKDEYWHGELRKPICDQSLDNKGALFKHDISWNINPIVLRPCIYLQRVVLKIDIDMVYWWNHHVTSHVTLKEHFLYHNIIWTTHPIELKPCKYLQREVL